jgi:hypothetical protein
LRESDKVHELVGEIPEWLAGEQNEQTVEFAEWLIEQAFVTDVAPVRGWSREDWMGLYGLWYQYTDYQAESDAFWDWVEPRGMTPAQITNNPEIDKQLRAEFHEVWMAQEKAKQ